MGEKSLSDLITMEISMVVPQKLKIDFSNDPTIPLQGI
jgi:hypothetical protein